MKISVITVSYNREKTIEQTIQSVLRQKKYCELEYIVIDGASTDRTMEVARKYEKEIDVLISEPDDGICDAFNKGIKIATGDIIGFLSSDDWYQDDTMKIVAEAFSKNPSAGMLFGDQYYADEQGRVLIKMTGDPEYEKYLWQGMVKVAPVALFIKREIYERYGVFDPSYKTAMDFELLLRFSVRGVKGVYVPAVFGTMRYGGESDQNYIGGYREVLRAIKKYGGNTSLVKLRMFSWILRSETRRFLERIGLQGLVNYLRKNVASRKNLKQV